MIKLGDFIEKNNLSPFNPLRTAVKTEANIFKTRDAKTIHNKVLNKISNELYFTDSKSLFNCFPFTNKIEEIKARQEFFSSIQKTDKTLLKELKKPQNNWKPPYGIIVVTEDESTFNTLNELNCPCQILISENDVASLENYDIVQVIDCEQFQLALEHLPQAVFLNSLDEVYLERYVEILSGWAHNINILKNKTNPEIEKIINEIEPLTKLLEEKKSTKLTREQIDNELEKINIKISEKVKELSISGESLVAILNNSRLPKEIEEIVNKEIEQSPVPAHLFNIKIPLTLDEEEVERLIRQQYANEFVEIAEQIKRESTKLIALPEKLKKLSAELLIFDFLSGIDNFIEPETNFPEHSQKINIENSKNIFLENPQEISFNLDNENKCSILTGANSGGKTTLLEHIIQIISLHQIGLPISGKIQLPLFQEIYYFAKNKGSMSKGAFETLLTQMSEIKPGNNTLILADEIEAVTEPGVAGKIVCATADYFLKKNCFIIIATHLGQEIQKTLPKLARIDGIEAKGLDENFNLIIDHNPVLGRLAHSTPELIVEKMANSEQNDYFKFVWNWITTS